LYTQYVEVEVDAVRYEWSYTYIYIRQAALHYKFYCHAEHPSKSRFHWISYQPCASRHRTLIRGAKMDVSAHYISVPWKPHSRSRSRCSLESWSASDNPSIRSWHQSTRSNFIKPPQRRPSRTSSIPPSVGPAYGLGSIKPTNASSIRLSSACSISARLCFRRMTRRVSSRSAIETAEVLLKLKPEKPDAALMDRPADSGDVEHVDGVRSVGDAGLKAVRSRRSECLG
jgi:hypothetical protein